MGDSPVGLPEKVAATQAGHHAADNIVRVDVWGSEIGEPTAVTQSEGCNSDVRTGSVIENSQNTVESPNATRAKVSRSRFSFANRKLYGQYNLFLQPLYVPQFLRECDETLFLEGRIKACPTKKNGQRFRVDWNFLGTTVQPEWLQSLLDNNDDNKRLLKAAISAQEARPVPGDRKSETTQEPAPLARTPARTTTVVIGPNGTPPIEVRARAAAAVGTASTYSSVSSLSSNSGGRSRRITRNDTDATVESDTDDGEELDELNNAYIELPSGTSPGDLMEEDDRVDDDVEGNSITGQIGSRLAGLQWKFEEIEPGTVPFEQPSLTEAETSLKPGVVEAFDDPFTALKVLGGFDYTFVARLTFNSNEYAKRYILPKYPNRVINGETWMSITVKEFFTSLE